MRVGGHPREHMLAYVCFKYAGTLCCVWICAGNEGGASAMQDVEMPWWAYGPLGMQVRCGVSVCMCLCGAYQCVCE